MTETAKSKIKNFKNQITEKFNVGEANGFRTYIGKLSPVNVLDMLDDIERSVTTDEKTVEKLQEQLNTAKKALTEIDCSRHGMQFRRDRNPKHSQRLEGMMSKLKRELRILRAKNQKLRNEVEVIRKHYAIHHSALVEIVNLSSLSPMINDIARKSLVDTGTTGCPVGPVGVVGKKGLTEDKLEGSGDE